jgi:hypothetical protein
MSATEHRDRAIEFVQSFIIGYEPAPAVVMLAGSRARGTFKQNSDYDLVFLYPDLPEGAWREMASHEGANLEIFAHDLRTFRYFLTNIELPSGEASLACMVDEGIAVIGAGTQLEQSAKELARSFLASGPQPLDVAACSQKRYMISDLSEALSTASSSPQRHAIGSALYSALGNFVLAANGRWVATGKALPRALRDLSPSLEHQFTEAFDQLYIGREDALLQQLITQLLDPFGGRLRAGFHQQAPSSWR